MRKKEEKNKNIICKERCFPLFVDLTLSGFGHFKKYHIK